MPKPKRSLPTRERKVREVNPQGQVIEALPNQMYLVRMEGSNQELKAHMSGKMKLARIQLLVGDKVEVVVDPYGGTASNRIVWRK